MSGLLTATLHFSSDPADAYDVSRSTANRAQNLLAGRGLIRREGKSHFAVTHATDG